MDCKYAKQFMTPWIDRELHASTGQELMHHLEGCPDCRREFELERRLKTVLTEKLPRVSAPPYLYQRILNALETPPASRTWRERLQEILLVRPALKFGALAALLILTVTAPLVYSRFHAPPPLITDLVQHHAMCAIQVVSNQPDEIRTWFQDQLSFAVVAPRFDQVHPRLLGAYLCQVANRKLAYLVYDVNGTRMSVCMLDGSSLDLDRLKRVQMKNAQFYTATYHDQNLVLWYDGDRICSLIGPMKQEDLLAIATDTAR